LENLIHFFYDEEKLNWLEAAWEKHEGLVRQGVEGEPKVVEMMDQLRFRIDAGRKWSPPKKGVEHG
jgi:hypothetical protein